MKIKSVYNHGWFSYNFSNFDSYKAIMDMLNYLTVFLFVQPYNIDVARRISDCNSCLCLTSNKQFH